MNWLGIFPYLYELVGDMSLPVESGGGYFPTCSKLVVIFPYMYELVGDISLPV